MLVFLLGSLSVLLQKQVSVFGVLLTLLLTDYFQYIQTFSFKHSFKIYSFISVANKAQNIR